MNRQYSFHHFHLLKSLISRLFCLGIFLLLLNYTAGARVSFAAAEEGGLFASEEVLELTLRGDMKALMKDRRGRATYRPMELAYQSEHGERIVISLKVKTRGNFRRQPGNCIYPPVLLNFAKKNTPENSLFAGQDKLKLVTPCRNEEDVVREYLVYKLYNLVTDHSFRARLVRVTYEDEVKDKAEDPQYGILLEDEEQLAERIGARLVKPNGLRPNKTEASFFTPMAVFQYMIGNTDWSTQYRHNVKLYLDENYPLPLPVPYDFDHAGIVDAPYAKPAPALELGSTQERLYRGYCVEDEHTYQAVVQQFNELKDAFYRLYTECVMLDDKYVKRTLRFLDEFYETINDPKAREKAFAEPCDPNGTVRIVIGGLKVEEE